MIRHKLAIRHGKSLEVRYCHNGNSKINNATGGADQ